VIHRKTLVTTIAKEMAIRYKGVIALAICVVLAAALLSLGWVNPAKEPVAQGDSLVKPQQWDEAIAAYGVAITIDLNVRYHP
jgi:hypothetical protein